MATTIQYYYPVGPYGPVCDYEAPDTAKRCRIDADCPPGYVCVDGVCVPAGKQREDLFDPVFEWNVDDDTPIPEYIPNRIVCQKDPETGEYFNCRVEFDVDPNITGYNGTDCLPAPDGGCYDWEEDALANFGLQDRFFTVAIGPTTCQPYATDINIRPIKFTDSAGNETFKYAREKSSPVTFPVDSTITTTSQGNAKFSDDGRSVEMDVAGDVTFKLEWDDNPSSFGTALGSITIAGVTWTQTPGDESGNQTATASLQAGSNPITFTNLNSANNPILVKDGKSRLCLKDGDGDDCNASFRITGVNAGVITANGLWGDNGNRYGVWVNPAECTLPCLEQSVTYVINFDETGDYFFEFGADDSGKVFYEDEDQPFIIAFDGISSGGAIRDPYTASRVIQAGNRKITVKCTNTNAQYVGSTDHMRYVEDVLLVRVDGTEERLSLGYRENDGANYFSPIARAVADEYLSGRFGRSESSPGMYTPRGRPPEPGGMDTHVNYYLGLGGSLTDNPVNPTYWAQTKTDSIVVGYNLGEINAADVEGVYYPSCGNAPNGALDTESNGNAWSWATNPGGWFMKICKGGPCKVEQTITNWYRVSGVGTWSSLMNGYAVWPSTSLTLENDTKTATYIITITKSDTYTLEYNGDNLITIYLNGSQIAQTSNFTTIQSTTINLTPGTYYLTMEVWNEVRNKTVWSDNPAGGAWLLKDSTNAIIRTSADLSTAGSGNLYWHTRLATGYEYFTI